MTKKKRPSRWMERFALARMSIWPVLLPAAILLGWKNSVFFVLVLSLYANFAGDFAAYQGARAERVERERDHDENVG